MAFAAGTLDNTTLTSQAILHISDGARSLKVKFPKVRPASADASDTAWQTRMTTEVVNAHNATLASGNNATPLLANLA